LRCNKIKIRKIIKSKRLQDIERLKSRIILYREINSNKNLIKKIIEKDLQKLIDTILVIETTIKVFNINP